LGAVPLSSGSAKSIGTRGFRTVGEDLGGQPGLPRSRGEVFTAMILLVAAARV